MSPFETQTESQVKCNVESNAEIFLATTTQNSRSIVNTLTIYSIGIEFVSRQISIAFAVTELIRAPVGC